MQHSIRRKSRQHKQVNLMLYWRQRNLLQYCQDKLHGVEYLKMELQSEKNNVTYWKNRFKQSQDWKLADQVIQLHNQMAAILRRNQPRISPTETDLANHIQVIEKFSRLITGKSIEQLMNNLGGR